MISQTTTDNDPIPILSAAADDLSHRLILPAVFVLYRDSKLPTHFRNCRQKK
jgi:hypothetical protein